VKVAGDLIGGSGVQAGEIRSLGDYIFPGNYQQKFVGGKIVSVTVEGDMTGGSIYSERNIGTVKVKSLSAGVGTSGGAITAAEGSIKSINVTGDVNGTGTQQFGASTTAGKDIGRINIGGSLIGGTAEGTAAITANRGNIKSVRVGGDILGGPGLGSASIRAFGYDDITKPPQKYIGGRIFSIQVVGSVIGGTGKESATMIADRSIGTIRVGADWIGASAAAGIHSGADLMFDSPFSGPDDEYSGFRGESTIASILIGGNVDGTSSDGTDRFAFLANRIGSISHNGTVEEMTTGPMNDSIYLGANNDFRLYEFIGPP
jgi:hypothetical protein